MCTPIQLKTASFPWLQLLNLHLVLVLVAGGKAVWGSGGEEPRLGLAEVVPSRSFLVRSLPAYRNYAFQTYTNYPDHTFPYADRPRAFFGGFGNYLITGYEIYTWNEERQKGLEYGSSMFKDMNVFRPIFDHVLVARDGYKNWGYSAMVGDGLIARFTPLTLSKVDFNGLRLDVATPYVQFTGLASRLERQPTNTVTAPWMIDEVHYSDNNTLLLGARVQGQVGALQLGLNGVNMHVYQSNGTSNSIRGRLRSNQPLVDWIVVRFTDDSPQDERGGAVVQEVQLIVNGQARSDLQPGVIRHQRGVQTRVGTVSRLTNEFRPVLYMRLLGVVPSEGRTFYRGREIPLFADYFYRAEYEEGADVSGNTELEGLLATFAVESPQQVLQADGDEQLIFLFDVSQESHVEEVAIEAVLANDYRVEVATLWEENPNARNRETQFRSTNYRTVRRAPGNVQDLSNLGKVRFEVGENTALFTYSADAHLALAGVEIRGEYARSALYSRYPVRVQDTPIFERGPRFSDEGTAYFLNAVRWFGRGRVGAEYFSIQPDFQTEMRIYLKREQGFEGGDLAGLTNEMHYWRLVQDNEDGDRYPDAPMGHVLARGRESVDVDPDGVFPGQDEDNDGIPDINRNFNSLPDYVEPFLMYYVDSSDYFYGLDRNNNDDPDVREDDLDVDYPYEYDQRGFHFFGQWDLTRHWSLGAGRYDVEQISGGGRNQSTYGLLNYRRAGSGRLRQVFFENNFRRVRDDIADEFSLLFEKPVRGGVKAGDGGAEITVNAFFVKQLQEDPLLYRDSYVNETYFEGRFEPWSDLNVVQKLRLRRNWQLGGALPGGLVQRDRRLDLAAWVSRVDYTWYWGRLQIQPQGKFSLLKLIDRDADRLPGGAYASRDLRSEFALVPILRLELPVMSRSALQVGFQGLGPLPYFLEDGVEGRNSFAQRTVFVNATNRSRYFGYDLHTIVGFQRDVKEFDDAARRGDGFAALTFFARALIGFTEYSRPL